MTHDQNLAAIRAACVAANPEILDFKYGCEVLVPPTETCQDEDNRSDWVVKLYQHEEGEGLVELMNRGQWDFYEKPLTILGRPITIGDVLLALGNTDKLGKEITGFMATSNGKILEDRGLAGYYLSYGCDWNPRFPLSGQSEETVAYLAGLLTGAKGTE